MNRTLILVPRLLNSTIWKQTSDDLAYANPLYTLRSHIALLRDELRHGRQPKQHNH